MSSIGNLFEKITRRFPPDFGKNPPWVAYAVFIPVGALQVAYWIQRNGVTPALPLGLLLGLALWTIDEYVMHRFAFHARSQHAFAKPFNSTLHRLHHDAPADVTFVAAPMILCIPSYALFFATIGAIGGFDLALTAGAGLIVGFLYYEWVHYATHHLPARTPWMRVLKKQHMTHHFVDPTQNFGVTSSLWDHVFGTMGTLGASGARPPGKK